MASELDHFELANRNHVTLAYLASDVDSHSEWVATIAFYKAVQIIEAVFVHHLRIHSRSHDNRIDQLRRPVFKELFMQYRPLNAASLVARYLEDSSSKKFDDEPKVAQSYRWFSDYRSPRHVLDKLLKKRLQSLEQHALPFLSGAARAQLTLVQKDETIQRAGTSR